MYKKICRPTAVYDIMNVRLRGHLQNTSSTLLSKGDMQVTWCMAMRWYISFPFSVFGVDAMGKKYPLHHAEEMPDSLGPPSM